MPARGRRHTHGRRVESVLVVVNEKVTNANENPSTEPDVLFAAGLHVVNEINHTLYK